MALHLEACRWRYTAVLRAAALRRCDQQATVLARRLDRPALARACARQSGRMSQYALTSPPRQSSAACRVKAGATPGYRRFRGHGHAHGRYDSIASPQVPVACKLDAEGPSSAAVWMAWGR